MIFRLHAILMVIAFSTGLLFLNPLAAFSASPLLNRATRSSSVPADDCSPFTLLSPFELPEGRVGTGYRQRIGISDRMRIPRYTVIKGRLPDGLKMDGHGQVAGIPRKQGRYQFTIQAWFSCETHANQDEATYSMTVRPRTISLSAQTQPESLEVITGKDAVCPVRYLLRSDSADGIKLFSSGGRFMVDRRTVGRTVQPMTVHMNGAATWANEMLAIRSTVIDAALRAGSQNITYVRDFTSKETSISVRTHVNITVASAPGLLIRSPIIDTGDNAGKINPHGSPAETMRISESQTPEPSVIPGQIVVTAEASPIGSETMQRLGGTYALTTIESFVLSALEQIVTVFATQGDVTELVKKIRKEQGVIHAQPNRLFQTYADPQDDLQPIYAKLNLHGLHRHYQGNGTRVAIIDTGVDIRHPDLRHRVIQHANLIRNNPYRAEIHGTAMAGVMAAGINGYGITGVAPRADLIALRACWQTSEVHPEGRCTSVSVAKALDLAIASEAQIVNMSFGASAPDRLMMQLLDAGARKSILFVAPVGNHRSLEEVPFPASHSKVLAVGGIDASGEFYPNAALASAADVCAPSGNALTTIAGGGHNFMSGTSVSAAIVTGILAVAKEKNRHLSLDALPAYRGDICRWQERLINKALCSPRNLDENDK